MVESLHLHWCIFAPLACGSAQNAATATQQTAFSLPLEHVRPSHILTCPFLRKSFWLHTKFNDLVGCNIMHACMHASDSIEILVSTMHGGTLHQPLVFVFFVLSLFIKRYTPFVFNRLIDKEVFKSIKTGECRQDWIKDTRGGTGRRQIFT